MFGKKKKPEQEFFDEPTHEVQAGLQAELCNVVEQIEATREEIGISFRQKMNGDKPDGEHNRHVDMLTGRLQSLQERQNQLLTRIDSVNRRMADIAFRHTD